MNILISINTDNDAFVEDDAQETSRILRGLADNFHPYHYKIGREYKLHDINGNTVGTLIILEDNNV